MEMEEAVVLSSDSDMEDDFQSSFGRQRRSTRYDASHPHFSPLILS